MPLQSVRERPDAGWRRTIRSMCVCLLLAAACLSACQRTVVSTTDMPAPGERDGPAYRYRIEPACVALIDQANRTPEDRAANESARACAYREDLRIRMQAQEVLREEARKQGEVMMDIPEFHDEQRLPIAGGKLGPKAGLYLSPFLGSFRERWQLENHPVPGVLAAYVVVMQENNEPLPGEYSDLGLNWGVNCLFLQALASGGYTATMVQERPGKPCREADGSVPGLSKSLQVTTSVLGGAFTQDSVVPASRFQEDNEGRAVFGLPCLDQWCQVSRPGKTPRQDSFCNWKNTDSDPLLNWTCTGKEMLVPSWYDEQLLEIKVGSDWVSTATRAAIVPRQGIGNKPESDFATPQHIATIYVQTMPDINGKYYRNGLRKGQHKVELVKRTSGWEFIVTAPDGTSRTWKVLGPHKHYDAPIPGTTRWRFTVRDMGIWGPCGQNCCDTDGFQ